MSPNSFIFPHKKRRSKYRLPDGPPKRRFEVKNMQYCANALDCTRKNPLPRDLSQTNCVPGGAISQTRTVRPLTFVSSSRQHAGSVQQRLPLATMMLPLQHPHRKTSINMPKGQGSPLTEKPGTTPQSSPWRVILVYHGIVNLRHVSGTHLSIH